MKLEALADKITYKSDGHFLWAALVLEDLHRTSYTNIESVEDFLANVLALFTAYIADA